MHAKRLEQRILRAVHLANRTYSLVGPGDRILVALSGGKDSYVMLWALQQVQAAASYDFELVLFHLDQGQPGHDAEPLRRHMSERRYDWEIEHQDTYTRVVEKTQPGKVYCSLCSRFRRAILYKAAIRHRCNKVALGHHRDDLIETLLLNLFFSGQLKSMPPKLNSEAGAEQVIRPLCLVAEEETRELAEQMNFPVMPCQLCGSQVAQRAFVKQLLNDLSGKYPSLKGNMLAALGNLQPSHLMDPAYNPLLVAVADPTACAALPLGERLARRPQVAACAESEGEMS